MRRRRGSGGRGPRGWGGRAEVSGSFCPGVVAAFGSVSPDLAALPHHLLYVWGTFRKPRLCVAGAPVLLCLLPRDVYQQLSRYL